MQPFPPTQLILTPVALVPGIMAQNPRYLAPALKRLAPPAMTYQYLPGYGPSYVVRPSSREQQEQILAAVDFQNRNPESIYLSLSMVVDPNWVSGLTSFPDVLAGISLPSEVWENFYGAEGYGGYHGRHTLLKSYE